MKTLNYNRTGTMAISYTVIMIRSAGAKFPPEYSDRNLIVKTACETDVAQWQLQSFSGCLSVARQLAQLIQSSLQQPLQYSTVVAVFLYVLLLIRLSLSLSLILIPQ